MFPFVSFIFKILQQIYIIIQNAGTYWNKAKAWYGIGTDLYVKGVAGD